MPTITEVRAKFPMYKDMPDDVLLKAVWKKHYSSMPEGKFMSKIDRELPDDSSAIGNFGKGVLSSAATLGNAIPGVSQLVDKIYGEEGISKKELENFKKDNEGTTGYQVGKLAGDIGLTLAPGMGAYRLVKAAGSLIPAGGRVAAAATELAGQGAAGAAGAGLTDSDLTEGAALGAAGGAVGHIAGKAYDIGKRVFEPAQRHAARHLQDAITATNSGRQYVLDTLRNTEGLVPGEMPTAGKAAVGAEGGPSLPWLKTLEEGARGRTLTGKFVDIDRANEAARLGVLEPTEAIGRDVYDQATGTVMPSPAKQVRSIMSDPHYQQANPDMVYVPPSLDAMLTAPEAQVAALRGGKSYAQAGANARAAGEVPPPSAIPMKEMGGPQSGQFGSMGNQSEPAWTQLPMRSIDDLQRIKNSLTHQIDALSKSTSLSAADALHLTQLRDARRQMTEAMRTQSPAYREGSRQFAEHSAPQNQSDVYHMLATALRKPGGLPGERLSSFMSAVENAPQTLKRAGLPRFKFLEQVLTPQQSADIGGLTSSLRREADYGALPNSKQALPEFLSPAEHVERNAPPWLTRWMTLTRHFLKKQAGKSDEQIAAIIDEAMTDPNRMADLIEALPPELQRQSTGAIGTVSGLMADRNNQGENNATR